MLVFCIKVCYYKTSTGISAAGSAFDWQSRGQGFDPPMLHQKKPVIATVHVHRYTM